MERSIYRFSPKIGKKKERMGTMAMNEEQKRLIIAVVFSSLILMAWQYIFPPNPHPQSFPSTEVASSMPSNGSSTVQSSTSSHADTSQQLNGQPIEEINYEFKTLSFTSSLKVTEFKSTHANRKFEEILGGNGIGIKILSAQGVKTPMFHMEQNEPHTWIGKDSNLNIRLILTQTAEGFYKFKLLSPVPVRYQFEFPSRNLEKSSRMKREFIIYNQKKVLRHTVGDEFNDEGALKWFGVDYDYHLFTYLLETPNAYFTYRGDKSNLMTASMTGGLEEVSGQILFTSKNYDFLKQLGSNLELSVDFGLFGIIAVPILKGLQFFYHFIPNYGISILILTLILRLVTFPLQLNSMKSMKKMQKIQPELNNIRERYKDDPTRLNMETMALFKRAKVNPLGGCLPILLQMPIFIAFYQVLNCAVELVNAPFFGHIKDLSIKDPYYIFPILMTLVMFVQQKLTPTSASMDASQQKVMQFMPLIFGFVMIEMPAGLTLYMFFSTLLGIGQQMLVNKYA